jgi:hypothetical protein
MFADITEGITRHLSEALVQASLQRVSRLVKFRNRLSSWVTSTPVAAFGCHRALHALKSPVRALAQIVLHHAEQIFAQLLRRFTPSTTCW